MGFHDRDYYRAEPTSFAAPTWTRSAAAWLGVAFLIAFLLDHFAGPDRARFPIVRGGLSAAVAVDDGEWWRIVTYPFMLPGIVNFLLAALALYAFGPHLERIVGPWRTLAIFFAGALAAAAVHLALSFSGSWLFSWEKKLWGPWSGLFSLVGAAFGFRYRDAELTLYLPLRTEVPVRGLAVLYAIGGAIALIAGNFGGPAALVGLPLGWAAAQLPPPGETRRPRAVILPLRRGAVAANDAFDPSSHDDEVDRILEKIAREGMGAVTPSEREFLERASKLRREARDR